MEFFLCRKMNELVVKAEVYNIDSGSQPNVLPSSKNALRSKGSMLPPAELGNLEIINRAHDNESEIKESVTTNVIISDTTNENLRLRSEQRAKQIKKAREEFLLMPKHQQISENSANPVNFCHSSMGQNHQGERLNRKLQKTTSNNDDLNYELMFGQEHQAAYWNKTTKIAEQKGLQNTAMSEKPKYCSSNSSNKKFSHSCPSSPNLSS